MTSEYGLLLFLVAVPLMFLCAAASARLLPGFASQHPTVFAAVALTCAVLAAVLVALGTELNAQWLAATPVSVVMLLLISFVALIITRYSRHYLAGEPRQHHYYGYMYGTLAAVALVVISNHLLLLVASWVAISLCFHQLLMFFSERPRAALAAHKKFIFARCAELTLFAAALLLYFEHGTWNIRDIGAAYGTAELSFSSQLAAVLIALTALIKCAQLPVHGWLIQVVEAPTPVSALLHAGIINLGGFLLILFAPLFVQSAPAQGLLLVVAGLTTLLAGLITMTRVSVKVRLAWSTSAQMGLMLVECALGLWELALLHLVAHSCYKAYAFLNAGAALDHHLCRELAPAASPSRASWALAILTAGVLVAGVTFYLAPHGPYSPWLLLFVTLGLVLAERSGRLYASPLLPALGLSALLLVTYALQKTGAAALVPSLQLAWHPVADLWFGLLIVLLFAGYLLLRYAAHRALGRRLWHALYAGLYLDEWATRITLMVWPARLPPRINPKQSPDPHLNREYIA